MTTIFNVLILLQGLVLGVQSQQSCPVNCGTGQIYDALSSNDPKCEKCWSGFYLAWSGTVS